MPVTAEYAMSNSPYDFSLIYLISNKLLLTLIFL